MDLCCRTRLYYLLDPNSHAKLNFTEFFNVIDGKLKITKETSQGVNPSTLEKNPPVSVSTREDVDRAVQAAKKASEAWAEVPYKERQALVAKFADSIDLIKGDLAVLLTKEQGKPVSFLVLWSTCLSDRRAVAIGTRGNRHGHSVPPGIFTDT